MFSKLINNGKVILVNTIQRHEKTKHNKQNEVRKVPIDNKAVRTIMLTKRISLQDLADKTKLSKARVSTILNSKSNLRNETITKIAAALEVEPVEILKEG